MKLGTALVVLTAATPQVATPPPSEPPLAFSRCATCHATSKGAPHGLGNNLFGIYGRKAGSMADYPYSDAMASSRIVWTTKTLDAFIADPKAVVPDTRMSTARMSDPAKRADIIAYLKGLR